MNLIRKKIRIWFRKMLFFQSEHKMNHVSLSIIWYLIVEKYF